MKNLVRNWSIKRFIYLLMGIFLIFAGVNDRTWFIAILGIYPISMALFNFGCAAGNCTLEQKK